MSPEPAIIMDNVYEQNIHCFTEKTKKAIAKKKATNLIEQYNKSLTQPELYGLYTMFSKLDIDKVAEKRADVNYPGIFSPPSVFDGVRDKCEIVRAIYQVRFLGSRYHDAENAYAAETKVIKMVNNLGEKGFIKGHLLEFGHIPFANFNGIPSGGAYISYLLFDEEGVKYLEDNKMDMQEGSMPPAIDGEDR